MNKKLSISKLGRQNPQWKEHGVSYASLHEWVNIHKPRPNLCEMCQLVPPRDLANKGTYDRDFDNWEYLCRRCHMTKDGRLAQLKTRNRARKETYDAA